MAKVQKDQEMVIDINWDATAKQTIYGIYLELVKWHDPISNIKLEITQSNLVLFRQPGNDKLECDDTQLRRYCDGYGNLTLKLQFINVFQLNVCKKLTMWVDNT